MYIVTKQGDKYRAVFQGEQVEVPVDAVESVQAPTNAKCADALCERIETACLAHA